MGVIVWLYCRTAGCWFQAQGPGCREPPYASSPQCFALLSWTTAGGTCIPCGAGPKDVSRWSCVDIEDFSWGLLLPCRARRLSLLPVILQPPVGYPPNAIGYPPAPCRSFSNRRRLSSNRRQLSSNRRRLSSNRRRLPSNPPSVVFQPPSVILQPSVTLQPPIGRFPTAVGYPPTANHLLPIELI